MMASCEICRCSHLTNKQLQTMQRQSHQSVEVVNEWRCLLATSIHMCSTTSLRHGENELLFSYIKLRASLPYEWTFVFVNLDRNRSICGQLQGPAVLMNQHGRSSGQTAAPTRSVNTSQHVVPGDADRMGFVTQPFLSLIHSFHSHPSMKQFVVSTVQSMCVRTITFERNYC